MTYMQKRQLLLATGNPGKIKEMRAFLQTLPFDILTLNDLSTLIPTPIETAEDIEGNAILKATYYGRASGMLSLSDDGGVYIDALGGWPGVQSARIAESDDARNETVLDRMREVPQESRGAIFRSALALYDPLAEVLFVSHGETRGSILFEPPEKKQGFAYDPIFFVDEMKKTYSQMSISEKNGVSHRGKALVKIKYHLQKTYGVQHIVVPFALIIKNKKILMILRHDPHRPEYHLKWEFPGGGVEFGEQMHENIIRETKEETGLDVHVVQMLQHIGVEAQTYPTFSYQVYLIPYVCTVIGGVETIAEEEVAEMRWFDLDEVLAYDLVGENKRMYERLLPELKSVVD